MSLQDGHQNNHHNTPHVKSDSDVPIDPSIAASSPTYPPYSPYAQQGHDMSHYQGQPPPGYPHWPQQYAGHPHGLPNGPYSSPGTAAAAAGAAATAGPRSSQVGFAPWFGAVSSTNAFRILIRYLRCTRLCRSRVLSSTSVPVVVTKKSNACTNVGGKDVKKRTAH